MKKSHDQIKWECTLQAKTTNTQKRQVANSQKTHCSVPKKVDTSIIMFIDADLWTER